MCHCLLYSTSRALAAKVTDTRPPPPPRCTTCGTRSEVDKFPQFYVTPTHAHLWDAGLITLRGSTSARQTSPDTIQCTSAGCSSRADRASRLRPALPARCQPLHCASTPLNAHLSVEALDLQEGTTELLDLIERDDDLLPAPLGRLAVYNGPHLVAEALHHRSQSGKDINAVPSVRRGSSH